MFKIVLNDGGKIPDEKILYIVSKNGLFLKKKIGIVESLTKVGGVSFLNEIKPYAKLHIPKIPLRTFAKIVSFFRKVYEVHHTECNAILYYNEKTQKFRTIIPPQETSGASVKYIRIPAMEGYVRLSTIHSHPTFGAFHSTTDTGDEKDSDGLHITVGKINQKIFEVVAAVVVGGSRFKVNPEDYIDGIQKVKAEVEKAPVIAYKGHASFLFNGNYGNSKIPLFTYTDVEDGYMFSKWSKKFERYNPNWIGMIKPIVVHYTYSGWDDELHTFDQDREIITFRDLYPEPSDVKSEGKEVAVKEFNPCGSCAFKSLKTKEKELTGDNHGTQQV